MSETDRKFLTMIPDALEPEQMSLVGVDPDLVDNGDYAVVWVDITCGNAVGRPRWQTTEIYESDECDWQARIRVDAESFENGNAQSHCPKCGQDLYQENGHMELAEPG